MMASGLGAIWAIEIGNDTLKALHLRINENGAAEVFGFDSISYGKILNAEGLRETERDELIALAIRNFLRNNPIGKDEVIISVPSQNSFARFVNLPPVEEKKIPQVVKLEAGMQIPFDMNEVQWDWQLLSEPGSGEARVGIFAVKNDVVNKEIDYYSNEQIQVTAVQMTPMALYNYLVYDRPELIRSDKQAVMVINIGAENTDLVVCTKSTIWQRCMPMGGNAFTRAIADTFKLNFSKAEKLKRTAAMSKYARQVFQAMRPVFSDFVSEIQRSLGFYNTSNPNTKLTNVIALGGGTKLRGLLKYLQQSLQVPVERPDTFKNLSLGPEVSAAKFHENVSDFGVVYGLGLQALGLGKIEINLLPRAIATSMMWARKARYITYAACALLLISALAIGRTIFDWSIYKARKDVRREIASVIEIADMSREKLNDELSRAEESESIIAEAKKIFEHRDLIPKVYHTVLLTLPNAENNPEQKDLYEAYKTGDIETIKQIPRKQRKQVFLTSLKVLYSPDVETSDFSGVEMSEATTGQSSDSGFFSGATMEDDDMMNYDTMQQGQVEDTERKGFVITLVGYTPYENFRELLDPAGVGQDRREWGVITRLMNLDTVFDGASLFHLYKKTERKHFEINWQEVSADVPMPEGIGIKEAIDDAGKSKSKFLFRDPLTKEIISKIPELDDTGREKIDKRGSVKYEVNDHWFILKFKLLWQSEDQTAQQSDIYDDTAGPGI